MGRKYLYYWPFYLIQDIYWCFIPYNCRECFLINQCRGGWLQWRKCYKGCLKIRRAKMWEYEEDKMKALLEYAEQEEKRGRL